MIYFIRKYIVYKINIFEIILFNYNGIGDNKVIPFRFNILKIVFSFSHRYHDTWKCDFIFFLVRTVSHLNIKPRCFQDNLI